MKLPGPIPEDGGGRKRLNKGCRRCWSLLGWRTGLLGGCGGMCDAGGVFAEEVGRKCCNTSGIKPHVDLNNLPILPPNAVKGYNAGCLKNIPTQEPELAPNPPPAAEVAPVPKDIPK
jgi:hypothetical protein